jgi:hypothetical protein
LKITPSRPHLRVSIHLPNERQVAEISIIVNMEGKRKAPEPKATAKEVGWPGAFAKG